MRSQVIDTRRSGRHVPRDPRRSVLVRVRARVRGFELDRALAAGVDPVSTPALAARAEMLQTRRVREALASTIYLTLKDSRSGTPPFSMRVPVARDAVRRSRGELLELAAELREASAPSVQGIAKASLLARDGTGPLYYEREPGALRAAVLRARDSL